MSGTLERTINQKMLEQMRKDTHKAMDKYLLNQHNDEADYQDFKMKLETWKEELGK